MLLIPATTAWQRSVASAFVLLLAATWLIYQPGLHGAFLFDDHPNLSFLETFGHSAWIEETGRLLLQTTPSQLGRPLSMISFAAQYASWPSAPEDFKYVNLLIHLINACLLWWTLILLGRLLCWDAPRTHIVGLLATALWLLHPLHVSTVLYVVQRMVELSALFTLAGLAAYLRGRILFGQGRIWAGYVWVCAGAGLGILLGTLSKENGLLLALYLLVLEITLLRAVAQPPYWRLWRWIFMLAPILAFATYLATHAATITGAYTVRDFTLGERLLTEARVLWDYTAKIVFPLPRELGLFHDDFPISRGWWQPPATVFAVAAWLMVAGLAVAWRARHPLAAFAVLWFLAGHVMESSVVGLMIYFEHRNYLPMLGFLLAASHGLAYGGAWLQTHQVRLLRALAGLWLAMLATVTAMEASLWGQPVLQTVVWAERRPLSVYAQSQAAATLMEAGLYPQAHRYYQTMAEQFPNSTGPYLLWLLASCQNSQVPVPDLAKVWPVMGSQISDAGSISALNEMVSAIGEDECALSAEVTDRLFHLLYHNPNNRYLQVYITKLYARYFAFKQDYTQALRVTDGLAGDIHFRMERVVWLVFGGRMQEAQTEIQTLQAQLTPVTAPLYAHKLENTATFVRQLQEFRASQDQRNAR